CMNLGAELVTSLEFVPEQPEAGTPRCQGHDIPAGNILRCHPKCLVHALEGPLVSDVTRLKLANQLRRTCPIQQYYPCLPDSKLIGERSQISLLVRPASNHGQTFCPCSKYPNSGNRRRRS